MGLWQTIGGRLGLVRRPSGRVPGTFWEVLTQGPVPLPQPLSDVGTLGSGGAEPKGTKQPLWQHPLRAAEISQRCSAVLSESRNRPASLPRRAWPGAGPGCCLPLSLRPGDESKSQSLLL